MSAKPDSEGIPAAESLIGRMKEERGYLYPEVEMAVRMDPEFMASYRDLCDRIFLYTEEARRGRALAAKQRELIIVALLAQRGRVDHVAVHVRKAFSLGATPEEVFETCQVALGPGGLPAFLTGLEALKQVIDEQGSEGSEK